ncbi:39S ribosomal protein L50, mitochondrial-like isoform X2 [Motacilla alba alba]|uniref:39S ribosomal protein L50, mitochondrial-like isoform X2 n=1 Tax=Motacilla alba alba TaxID=1094192 RepID=UPI0018D58B13|nr:39S ribosomal protein L50, mitochondrial-like isoform X2 [Motacilla alba alba]
MLGLHRAVALWRSFSPAPPEQVPQGLSGRLWNGLRKGDSTGSLGSQRPPRKEEREVEADGAVREKEERSEPSLIHPPPRRRSYVPPEDLQSCLESHVREVFGACVPEDWQQAPLQENRLKHRLLARLAAELGHAVPNSQLHRMRRAGDVLGFYRTPVKDGTKIDELAAAELPPNLKIIWQQ